MTFIDDDGYEPINFNVETKRQSTFIRSHILMRLFGNASGEKIQTLTHTDTQTDNGSFFLISLQII